MNPQLKPPIDAVLPHPHPICALHDTLTLDLWLDTRSSDLNKPNSGHPLPQLELSEPHKTHTFSSYPTLQPIQRP